MTSNGFLLNSKRCNIKISVVSFAWKPGAKRRGFIVSYWSYTSQGVYNRCLYISLLRVTRAAFSPMQVLLMCQDIISFSILIVGVSSQSDSVTFVTVNIDHSSEGNADGASSAARYASALACRQEITSFMEMLIWKAIVNLV